MCNYGVFYIIIMYNHQYMYATRQLKIKEYSKSLNDRSKFSYVPYLVERRSKLKDFL